jgi:hypothetical protein
VASDRDTLNKLMAQHVNYFDHEHDKAIDAILAAGFRSHTKPEPGVYVDDSPTWITAPSRRHVLKQGESVTLDGPAVVLHLPIATKEARDGE